MRNKDTPQIVVFLSISLHPWKWYSQQQADKHTNKQTDRQTNKQTHTWHVIGHLHFAPLLVGQWVNDHFLLACHAVLVVSVVLLVVELVSDVPVLLAVVVDVVPSSRSQLCGDKGSLCQGKFSFGVMTHFPEPKMGRHLRRG